MHEKDKKATLAHGEVLLVKLPARLGAGYSWQVVKNDKSHLKSDGEPKVEDIPGNDEKKQGRRDPIPGVPISAR